MTSTVNCLGWMQSQKDQTPCATAQEVGQLCDSAYVVSLTNFEESQYIPNATTGNGCTCSWSIYNLLSACSYCVGQSQYPSWNAWTLDCGKYVSNTSYLPSGLRIPQGIPFWSAKNPFSWENATFDITQAADIAAAAQPDLTGESLPTSTTASSSSNGLVGAMVGGVIGVLLLLIISGLFLFCVVRRRRNQRAHRTGIATYSSDTQLDNVPPRSTLFGHTIAHVLPGFITPYLMSPLHSAATLAPRTPASFTFSNEHSVATTPVADTADRISPFLAMSPTMRRTNPPNASSLLTGKAAETLIGSSSLAVQGQRTRLNPPPYSALGDGPGSSLEGPTDTVAWSRRLSIKKEKKRTVRVSGATMATGQSGHSRPSTRESAMLVRAATHTDRSDSRAPTPFLDDNGAAVEHPAGTGHSDVADSDGGVVEMGYDRRTEVVDHTLSAV